MRDPRSTLIRPSVWPEGAATPVVTPLMPSVVYAAEDPDALDAQYEGRTQGYAYAREGHPNADLLARRIDALEGVENGIMVSSGMAAVTVAVMALVGSGGHVVGSDQLYGRSLRLLRQDLPRFGVVADLVDTTDAARVEAALRPETGAILVEVVSNPTLRVADLDGIAALARARGIPLIVDNTFTTPRAIRPAEHGADIVLHSVTKLLAGHADATLGHVAARDPGHAKAIYDLAVTMGLTASPFDCWLAERGLATFDLRYDRAEANAAALADHLAGLQGVRRVIYPGRADHPDHARASALLGERACNMVSFEIAGGRDAANALARAAEGVAFAPTLGDVGTTLSHPASSSHRALSEEGRAALGISEGFFRVSAGLEETGALCEVFTGAVRAATRA